MYNNEIAGYGMFLHPLFLHGYSDVHVQYMKEKKVMPQIQEGDFDVICQSLDFYGLNFYNGIFDMADEMEIHTDADKAGGNFQSKPVYYPEIMNKVLHMLVEKYKIDIPIYVTENGLPQEDSENIEDLLNDQERIDYIQQILISVHKAIEDNIPVKGYYIWTLMDNFEWSAGYSSRYGMHYTDFESLERIPKKSAEWYSNVIKEHGFTV